MADKKNAQPTNSNTPGTIVLQWLTYAFWGWTIVAISYLAAVITSYLLGGAWVSDSIEPIAYGIAATLILLPFSVVCDWMYSKREKSDKHGIASVVMIIHAVLFALVAIGALISVAFSVVGLLLSTGDNTGSITAIVVSAVLVILYAILIARIVRPLLFAKFRLFFRVIMSLVAVAALTWGIIGPVTQAVITKDDRAVRDGLTSLNYAINQYVSTNYELPETLQTVTNDNDLLNTIYPAASSQTLNNLIDRNLITYTPNTKPPTDDSSAPIDIYSKASTSKTFYYELCGVFAHDLKQRSWYTAYPEVSADSDGYGFGINEGTVSAGTKCYKLSTSYYKED